MPTLSPVATRWRHRAGRIRERVLVSRVYGCISYRKINIDQLFRFCLTRVGGRLISKKCLAAARVPVYESRNFGRVPFVF